MFIVIGGKFTYSEPCCKIFSMLCFIVLLQVKILARELYDSNFKAAESHPRDVVAKLHSIVQKIELACELHSDANKVGL